MDVNKNQCEVPLGIWKPGPSVGPGASPRIASKQNGCGTWTQALNLCLLKKKNKAKTCAYLVGQKPGAQVPGDDGWKVLLDLAWLPGFGACWHLDFSHSIKLSVGASLHRAAVPLHPQ